MNKRSLTQWFFSHDSGVWHRSFLDLDSDNISFENKIACSIIFVDKTNKYHGFVFCENNLNVNNSLAEKSLNVAKLKIDILLSEKYKINSIG